MNPRCFKIDGKVIPIDVDAVHYEFHVSGDMRYLERLELERIMSCMVDVGSGWWRPVAEYLARWKHDAPRKDYFRKQIKAGYTILSCEHFFLDVDDARWEQIRKGLQRTGNFFSALCAVLKWEQDFYKDKHVTSAPLAIEGDVRLKLQILSSQYSTQEPIK